MGDSRAIIGSVVSRGPFPFKCNKIVAEQITKNHSASWEEEVRRELKEHGVGVGRIEVKGKDKMQIYRTLGYTYFMRYAVPQLQLFDPIKKPIYRLMDDLVLSTREFRANDRFFVFASNGFWQHITNQQVVEIVHNNPRSGIGRRLLKLVMTEAARKGNTRYDVLRNIDKGSRRSFHDDITIIVVFVDYKLLDQVNNVEEAEQVSIQGFSNSTRPSMFKKLQTIYGS